MVVAKWAHASSICPPLGLAYIAAAVKQAGYDLRCIDSVGEAPFQKIIMDNDNFIKYGLTTKQILDKLATEDFHILFVSLMFSHDWPIAKSIIKSIKKEHPNILLICGGEHINACPEFCLNDCSEIDVCAIGEGEETCIELLSAIEQKTTLNNVKGIVFRSNDEIKRTETRNRISNIDNILWPAWDLFPLENYLKNSLGYGVNPGRSIPLLVSRGCPYECTFCSSKQMWTTTWQARDIDDVIKEMDHYITKYKVQNFDFYDLTSIVKKDWIVKFCKEVIDRNWNITWQMPAGTRSEALDEEALKLMYLSGQRNITYAPESGSRKTLKIIKKKINLERMKKSIKSAISHELNVKLSLIMGFPHETFKEILETLKFLKDVAILGVNDVYIACFSPYPGSELFEQLSKNGQINKMDDEYFLTLTSYSDMRYSKSYSPHLSNRMLTFYRLGGMVMFYIISYILHPKRIFTTIYNVINQKEESRLDMALIQLIDRLKRSQKKTADPINETVC